MDNNNYLAKLDKAKEFLKEAEQKLVWWKKDFEEVDKIYVNEYKENVQEMYGRWIVEEETKVEAFSRYISEIEMQIKQGEDHDADEAKVAELRNEANAMCEHND